MSNTRFYPATEDIAVMAKHLRGVIKDIPGAVFSVKVNRQWAKLKDDPHSVIYISGMIKFWGDDYTDKKQEQSNLKLINAIKDLAEGYQLEIIEGMYASKYTLVQHH